MMLRLVSRNIVPGYEGMDRDVFGKRTDVPRDVILRGIEIESLPPDKMEMAYRDLLVEVGDRYELLRLDESDGADWEFLGYDVGETTSRAWSALVHQAELGLPKPRLNRHGLFQDRDDAERFLSVYLECEDPDRDWAPEDQSHLYAVVPVRRFVWVASGEMSV